MIITRLRLYPFAGIAERTVEFRHALTVVLGPNEAGKSTLMAALRLLLFTPAECGKRRFGKEVAPYMPLGGGDTIRAELQFSVAGNGDGRYCLSRAWGEGARSELQLPDGNLLAGDDAVQATLDRLLGFREGTWHSVLFAGQSAVGDALGSLEPGGAAVTDLAAILRRAVFETDGISIEQLEQEIDRRHNDCYRRWDRELHRPENNRGIDNPYRREVGRILQAFYDRERAQRARDAVLGHEQQLDDLNLRLNRLADETALLGAFLEENRQAAGDARRRKVKELERQSLAQEEEALRRITTAWPAAEQELKGLTGQRDALAEAEARLGEELERAVAAGAARQDEVKLERAEREHQAWLEATEALAGLRSVGEDDYQAAVSLHQKLQQLTAGLRAGRITLSFTPHRPVELTSRGDVDDPADHRLAAGECLELQAGGQISLEHEQWSLEVSSGEAQADDLCRDHQRLSSDFTARLQTLGFPSLTDAGKARAAWAAAESAVETCRQRLDTVLDGEEFEALRSRAASGADSGGHRPVEAIARDQGRTTGEIREIAGLAGEKQRQVAAWQAEFSTSDNLLDRLLEKRSALKSVEEQLAALTPLPEGDEDAGGFVARFESRQEEHRQLSETLTQLKMDRLELQSRGPGETVEEAEAALRDAVSAEQKVLREAAAVDRIREEYAQVRASMDTETMDPWVAELQRMVTRFTGGRYLGVGEPDGGARRPGGTAVPADRLSTGTRAGLGLAVRLSMARYFLRATDGFLVLDDPLVDMDPERQAAAAELLGEFAADRQTVIFTCHPAHAELLGGCLVQLQPPGGEEQ